MRRVGTTVLFAVSLVGAFLAGRAIDTTADVVEGPDATSLPSTVPVRTGLLEEEITLAAVEVVYQPLMTVHGRGGTITTLPAPGSTVEEGEVLLTVDLRPMVVLHGQIPMFRSMTARDQGIDVSQLQQALSRLDVYDGPVDGIVGAATLSAWEDLLKNLGFDTDRSVPLEEVLFVAHLPARVQAISTAAGTEAAGELLSLSKVDPQTIAYLPEDAGDDLAVGSPVEVLDGPDSIRGTIREPSRIDAEQVAILDLDEPLEVGRSYRARILSSPIGPGLIVPLTAVYTAVDGATYVRVLNTDTLEHDDIPIVVVEATSTEALISGPLSDGDELVVSS